MTMLHEHDKAHLPTRWCRPRPDLGRQATLFPFPVDEVLADLHVSRDDLRRWHQAGWISFDLADYRVMEQPFVSEIEFVRSIARSGLSDAQINKLLRDLPKPFRFRSEEIAFNFVHGWVIPVQEAASDIIEDNIDDWLDDLATDENVAALRVLAEKIANHLAALEADQAESEEEIEDV